MDGGQIQETGRQLHSRQLFDRVAALEDAHGLGRDEHAPRARGEQELRARVLSTRELAAVVDVGPVVDGEPEIAVGPDAPARPVVDHRRQDAEVRVAAHRVAVSRAMARDERGGADRVREGRDDPDAVPVLAIEVEQLRAFVRLRNALPRSHGLVEVARDDDRRVDAQVIARLAARVGDTRA